MILGVWEVAFRGWIYQQEDGKTLFIEQHLVHFPEGNMLKLLIRDTRDETQRGVCDPVGLNRISEYLCLIHPR